MKAVDFIKKFGWEMSKAFLNNWSSLSEDYGFKVDDLKQYVDAWELVSKYGGLVRAKDIFNCFKNACDGAGVRYSPKMLILKQAIALVEEVENV